MRAKVFIPIFGTQKGTTMRVYLEINKVFDDLSTTALRKGHQNHFFGTLVQRMEKINTGYCFNDRIYESVFLPRD